MMLTDEEIIEVIAKRADEECGFSKLSTVLNHYSWVDVFTHLMLEKGLRDALLEAYKPELEEALQTKVLAPQLMELREDYKDWIADVPTRGGA